MIVAAGGRALVTEGLVHKVGRRGAVNRVGGMGVPQPVG